MKEIQVNLILKIIAFPLTLFLLGGCATASRKAASTGTTGQITSAKKATAFTMSEPQRQHKKCAITDDVLAFLDLQQVDLDKDGTEEIVAVYISGTSSTGVKVIKISDDRASIIYERIFDTPGVFDTPKASIAISQGAPTITFDDIDKNTGRKSKTILRWDGKCFQ
jgi:hypothetical protein